MIDRDKPEAPRSLRGVPPRIGLAPKLRSVFIFLKSIFLVCFERHQLIAEGALVRMQRGREPERRDYRNQTHWLVARRTCGLNKLGHSTHQRGERVLGRLANV